MQDIDPLIFDIQPLQPKCLPGSKIEDEQNKRTNLPEQENQPSYHYQLLDVPLTEKQDFKF